jgi:hypothetical protein
MLHFAFIVSYDAHCEQDLSSWTALTSWPLWHELSYVEELRIKGSKCSCKICTNTAYHNADKFSGRH